MRCKPLKKASEGRDGAAILSLNVSPQNLRCGSRTVVKQARLPPVDVQVLGGFPRDRDSEDVRKHAEEQTRSWTRRGSTTTTTTTRRTRTSNGE